jgi:hypothetical protein
MNHQYKIFTNFSDWHKAYTKNVDFSAIKIDGVMQPFEKKEKTVFVYGKGHTKINSKNVINVPSLTPQTDIKEYLQNFGPYCLYFALTGRLFNSNDCSYRDIENEFHAMLTVGIDVWIEFISKFHELFNLVNSIYQSKYGVNATNEVMQTTKQGTLLFRSGIYVPRLNHYIFYPFKMLPTFDVIEDDKRLLHTYVCCELNKDYEHPNLKGNNFPESMKDRLSYLFNIEVATMYESLMNFGFEQSK